MIQMVFIALLIVALLAGYLAAHPASPKNPSPVKFMMDNSGYTDLQATNTKRTQEINMTTSKGIMQIRNEMDTLALLQKKYLDTIHDQQLVLKDASKGAADILKEAKAKGQLSKNDLLQLESLTSELSDQQRLLVNHGQYLITLNDQLAQSRQTMSDQLDSANIITDSSLRSIQAHNSLLEEQASDFFEKVKEHDQEVRDQMDKIQSKFRDMVNNPAYDNTDQQQSIKMSILNMLDKQNENMKKLAGSEERYKDLLRNNQQKIADSKQQLADSEQQSEDLVNEEIQKQDDQQEMSQQRMEDQKQRMQDLQDDRNQ